MTKNMLKRLLVFLCICDLRHSRIQACAAHLTRVNNWKPSLLLERVCPAVPKLRFIVHGIENGRRITLTNASRNANRRRLPVGEG